MKMRAISNITVVPAFAVGPSEKGERSQDDVHDPTRPQEAYTDLCNLEFLTSMKLYIHMCRFAHSQSCEMWQMIVEPSRLHPQILHDTLAHAHLFLQPIVRGIVLKPMQQRVLLRIAHVDHDA